METYIILLIVIFVLVFQSQLVGLFNQLAGNRLRLESGGEEREIEESDLAGTLTFSREFGSYGTKLITVLGFEETGSVKIHNARIDGPTGAQISVFGQKIGFGVSYLDSYFEDELQNGTRTIKVFITIKRIHLFILNENATFLVGTLVVRPSTSIIA